MKTTFFIARHGETEWNTQKRLQGQLDSPLTQTGIIQAELLAKNVSKYPIDTIVCSPLNRALTTAKICSQIIGLPVIQNRQLIERNFGDWQGCYFESLRDAPHFESIFYNVTSHAPPNGESGINCKTRLERELIKLLQSNLKNILIISHGDLIRCFLAKLTANIAIDAYSQYGNGSVFKIDYNHDQQKFSLEH